MTTTSPPTLSDEHLQQLAEEFIDALLNSADVDTIGAIRWWDRAKTALETGAASSSTWPQCVARAARKLQIETLSPTSSATVALLGQTLGDPAVYGRWARLAARDAVYTVAIVRARRDARREARKAKTAPTAAAAAVADDALPGF